jgi:hypothetical protein
LVDGTAGYPGVVAAIEASVENQTWTSIVRGLVVDRTREDVIMRPWDAGIRILGVALVFLFATADVYGRVNARAGLDSRVPSMALTRDTRKQEVLSSQTEWLDFKSRHGGQWKALWRESTGTPHRVYGGSIKLLTSGAAA